MKDLLAPILFLFLLSCSGIEPDEDEPSSPDTPEPEASEENVEEPVAPEDDPFKLADPVTTDSLLQEEDKKTVSGPVSIEVPEPPAASPIEIKPPAPEGD